MKDYDVIVVGGGVAGCSAALAAKRKNLSVLLLEKQTMLGGLGTSGHIVIYLPLDDGYGHQVITGISEELLHLSAKYAYYAGDYKHWKKEGKRMECKYNGPAFALALEEKLIKEGVDVLYDTLFVGSSIEKKTVKAVYVENKSGRSKIACKAVIDASGDADVFVRAKTPYAAADNSLAIWLYATQGEGGCIQKRGGQDAPGLKLVSFGTIPVNGEKHVITTPYRGDSGEEVNRFITDGHKTLLAFMKKNKDFVPASLPGMPDIRMARRIEGPYVLSDKDANMHFEDNVGGTGDWRRPGPVYEIPYRTLYSNKLNNVFAAGRCISADGEAWEITRCIPQAALTGQIAGAAAAYIIEKGIAAKDVDVREFRNILKKDKVTLDINE